MTFRSTRQLFLAGLCQTQRLVRVAPLFGSLSRDLINSNFSISEKFTSTRAREYDKFIRVIKKFVAVYLWRPTDPRNNLAVIKSGEKRFIKYTR